MTAISFKLPDLGEGTVSSEIVAWLIKPGDQVTEGQIIAEMSTDKALVELPAPVTGKVVSLAGAPGDVIAVGSELIVFETSAAEEAVAKSAAGPASAGDPPAARRTSTTAPDADKPRTSPAIRRRAREAGIDLASLTGSGPNGRIAQSDLEVALSKAPIPIGAAPAQTPSSSPSSADEAAKARGLGHLPATGTQEIKVLGVRRVIAQRMSAANRLIPHFSYVEEVDVTELESLRQHLNARHSGEVPPLTPLPFIVLALVRALKRFPQCNAQYDESRETIMCFSAVHVGIATQTKDGLKVPVVRDAESKSLYELAAEIRRVAEAARSNQCRVDELSGSTITVTSLGKLGGIVSTPIINSPELSIIGVNRMMERVVVHRGAITIRQLMNLSSSFDHRFVDGHDAAALIHALKGYLEQPASIFIGVPPAI